MKKSMSKFLSIVLSAATVLPMVGMNPAKAMDPPESAVESTEYQGLIEFLKDCSCTGISIGGISYDGINVNVGEFVAKNIYNLNNFLMEYSGQGLQDLCPNINSDMAIRAMDGVHIADQRLRYLYILNEHLLRIPTTFFKNPEFVYRQLFGFRYLIRYMVLIVKNLLQESDLPTDYRKRSVEAINLTIEKIGSQPVNGFDVRYLQDINDEVSRYI